MYIVSSCLLGINCKYSGGNNKSDEVIEFLKDKKYIAVCPECLGGLDTPRVPSERKDNRVITSDGVDVTNQFILGANLSIEKAFSMSKDIGEEIEGAILKSNSPSCGKGTIYDGSFKTKLIDGNGVFAEKLLEKGISIKTEKEL